MLQPQEHERTACSLQTPRASSRTAALRASVARRLSKRKPFAQQNRGKRVESEAVLGAVRHEIPRSTFMSLSSSLFCYRKEISDGDVLDEQRKLIHLITNQASMNLC